MDSVVTETEVLIVGASTTGLVAAIALQKYGVSFRLIEKAPTAKKYGPIDCLQPRTLEVLQTLRLKETLEKQGSHVRETASWSQNPDRQFLAQEKIEGWTDTSTLFPYDLVLNQGSLETSLEQQLASRGVVIDRSLELVHLRCQSERDPPFVTAYVHNHISGCIEIWRSHFVIGCDGVNSDVRKLSGISLIGPELKLNWIIATVRAKTDFPDHRRRAYVWSQNQCIIMTPGQEGTYHLRLLLSARDVRTLNETAWSTTNSSVPISIATSKVLNEILERNVKSMLVPYQFTIHQVLFIDQNSTSKQIASRFCDEHHCTFLLGKSSHTHSLCADHHANPGIADAYSLMWKLALVCKQKATRSILKTHSPEQQSLALRLNQRLGPDVISGEGDHFEHEEKQTLIAAHTRRYLPNPLIRQEVRNTIKANAIVPGKIITLPPVLVQHSSGNEVSLLDEVVPSGKFHLFIFAGSLSSHALLLSLCSYFSRTSALWSLDSTAAEYAVVSAELYLIHSSPHLEVSLADLPSPFTGSDRVYEDVAGETHRSMGICECLGALVLVRPDLVVSIITKLDDAPSIAKFLSTLSEA